MTAELVRQLGGGASEPAPARIYGVTVCEVVNNVDATMQGRVQVRLPFAGGLSPWARVATMGAGLLRGAWMQPQIGDEVLVAFKHGDLAQPYIIGALWSTSARPPILAPADAATKTIIRTRLGHEIVLDEATQSITITTTTQQKVTLDPTRVALEAAGGAASVTAGTDGSVTLAAAQSVTISAPTITINGANVTVNGTGTTAIQGGVLCSVQGALVKIN